MYFKNQYNLANLAYPQPTEIWTKKLNEWVILWHLSNYKEAELLINEYGKKYRRTIHVSNGWITVPVYNCKKWNNIEG